MLWPLAWSLCQQLLAGAEWLLRGCFLLAPVGACHKMFSQRWFQVML